MKARSNNKKSILILVSAALVVIGAIGVTLALLRTQSEPAVNQFAGSMVNIGVKEGSSVLENGQNTLSFAKVTESSRTIQKDVKITNIHSEAYPTADTYVRVRVVPMFRYESGEHAGEIVPVDISGVSYGGISADWKQDGAYYYFTKKLAKAQDTSSLFTSVSYAGEIPANAVLEVQVLAEGISAKQSTDSGVSVAKEVWGVEFLN